MDPTWISPPPPAPPAPPAISASVPFTLEANNHMPPLADNATENPNPNHPSYDEMIHAALGALKEKDGSSKRAIGKYIEQTYKDLPPTHSALLTHHLNRLKASGHLVMVKKSYKLPGSHPSQPSSPQTQRPRGRPPKPKLPTQPQSQPTEPVWAALGLSDDPAAQSAKRGPGRPRKIGALPVGSPVPGRRGRPPGSGRSKLPKRPGRPPKPKSVSAFSSGLKRRPGRPPKIQSNLTVIPFAAPVSSVTAGLPTVPPAIPSASVPNGSPRPRGRPRKNAAVVGVMSLSTVGAAPRGRGRGRGRGRKVLPVMRQGRPPKLAVGRPVGRPKGATDAITAQKAANEELRGKLEHFQSKVKESLGVLKPYFNHESPVTAIAAIQDLEVLATMDLKAPLADETQQLQQSPQQMPQPQMYEQQYPQISTQPQLQQFFQPHTSALS
ncbi:histone H1-like [Abrus precatorius]|uniref:Histone H1-like n=1 Tax=Abrus precatorius TaxID=3816 RepID=A0A8B8KJD7_ABRPR|nr:histone H1-like [Abrus precatorius]